MRSVPLLFLGCMPYGICSDPWLVRFTIQFLHVVPIMLYLLAYCGLLHLSLVGLSVCGYSQIILIYLCKLIAGDEFLVAGVYSELLLLAIGICSTIRGGNFRLSYIKGASIIKLNPADSSENIL